MTRSQLAKTLRDAGIPDAGTESLILLESIFGISRGEILADPRKDYPSDALENAIARRLRKEPLQYILGQWPFMNEIYEVSPDCLIPRQETELLCEMLIRLLPVNGRFLDLCTGSGCIAISALCARNDTTAEAVDLYPETLRIAEKNAERNRVRERIRFHKCDITQEADATAFPLYDCIVSNPPYISTSELDRLEPELAYEPRSALDGGSDGLRFYRPLIRFWSQHLMPNGTMLLEIGADQGDSIVRMAEQNSLYCRISQDYAGLDRIAALSHTAFGD